jgi:hypothetical protein
VAGNQTADVTPIQLNSALPYQISVQPYDFGPADLPTLHSYNAAELDGKWIVFAGRTNGLHGFDVVGVNNFPPQFQNQEVWVIDPLAKQSWHRSLTEASANVTAAELRSLTPANTQFYQTDDRLYVTGGYGLISGVTTNGTQSTLSSIYLPELMDWVVNDTPMAATAIRQASASTFTVTGGSMFEMNGRTHLVFGQNFQGNYTPSSNGAYTSQVRSFDIVDDGVSALTVTNVASILCPSSSRIRVAGWDKGCLSCRECFSAPRLPIRTATAPGRSPSKSAIRACRRWTTRSQRIRSSRDSTAITRPSWVCFPRPAARCTRSCSAGLACKRWTPRRKPS